MSDSRPREKKRWKHARWMSCAPRWHRFGPHLQLPALRGDISNVLLVGWIACCDRAHNCDLISAVFCFTQFVSVSRFHLDQTRSDEIKHCGPKEALGIELRWKNCHPAMLLSSQSATEGTNMGDVGRCFGNVFLVFVFFSTISILYWIGWSSSTYQNGSVVAFLSGLLFQVHLPATHVDDEWHEQRTCGPSHLVRPSWSADAFSRRWLTTLLGILCMTFPEISDCIDDSKACRKSDVPQQTSTDNPKILHHFFRYVCIYIYNVITF